MRRTASRSHPDARRCSRRARVVRSLAGPGLAALGLACRPTPPPAPPPAPPRPTAPAEADAPTAPTPELPLEPPENAEVSVLGVPFVLLEPGDPTEAEPQWIDFVELRYRVWDEEGRLVGQSRRSRTERLSVSWLPRGWAEIVMRLHPGAHAHAWVPAELAYGNTAAGPRGALRIDMHLVSVERTAVGTAADVSLQSPPPTALRTASGLAFVVLRPGTGTRHAAPDGRVTVHYEGWTAADGNRFDSSYARGEPVTFPLTAVIAGWQEAVPLMVEGEKTRFWIPGAMAYGDAPGRPSGTLVFDIELIHIAE